MTLDRLWLVVLSLGLGGCTVAREVDVCRTVAAEMAGRFAVGRTSVREVPALESASRTYRTFADVLDEASRRASTSLRPSIDVLARESRQIGEGLERAARARESEKLPSYRSAERAIDAGGRRFKEAAKEFERACRAGR